ncbi:hypothetical protein DMB37_12965 [Nocardia sp. CS682]|nr:hypothetical protein DMB37_12965 [Nocardia sp. CS682]
MLVDAGIVVRTSFRGAMDMVQTSRPGMRWWGMAKHRRRKSKAPVDYGIVVTGAVVIAGALILVRRVWQAR